MRETHHPRTHGATKEYTITDIQVATSPLYSPPPPPRAKIKSDERDRSHSVASWGGILLDLCKNVEDSQAGSKHQHLRFITGRHDLPFYYKEEIKIQRSFLDAFLKVKCHEYWPTDQTPKADLLLQKGDVGFNNGEAEKQYPRRTETEWPVARTQYTRSLSHPRPGTSYITPRDRPTFQFLTSASEKETEITGHIFAHLNVVMSLYPASPTPKGVDLFLTAGDPVRS
ncbi:uncharacterized protein N7496_009469 [Penicillium cataractarum]|uniref:Uncharacterized protein n=1 Tax=Penicillium cataractarum TaxID=2100454 RepID=A0A9W9RPJ7_9EURO|nr:uncharacterized protein N7496_009469 [Penicillium cataractarum]KAJ5363756.1 hypothetical protein N7496_009469 [Penicillium cataractarum]